MRSHLPIRRITFRSSRTYSCSSSASKPTTTPSTTPANAPVSKLRMAMTARKLLGAEGSGRLAMRRESLSSRRPSPKPARAGFTSAAAAFIADPHAFRPVHLYAPQYALHASFTPAHMPLPVHLGVQTYYKPDERYPGVFEKDDAARSKAVRNVQKVASRKGISNLREHLATVANFSTDPSLAALLHHPLPAAGQADEPTVAYDGFTLGDFTTPFGPTADSPASRTFDEMVRARLGGAREAQSAGEAWESVLDKMQAAVEEPARSAKATPSSRAEIHDAVGEVESLLSTLGLGKPRTAFTRRASTPRVGRITYMARRPIRLSAIGSDVALDQMAWMDSVKRKRQKKISKHKYKKRRKATRAERKKLGK